MATTAQSHVDHRDQLNRMGPAAAHAHLGSVVYDLITNLNALCAHLDAANVTGLGTANLATFGVKLPEQR